jgi:hypothetical protein
VVGGGTGDDIIARMGSWRRFRFGLMFSIWALPALAIAIAWPVSWWRTLEVRRTLFEAPTAYRVNSLQITSGRLSFASIVWADVEMGEEDRVGEARYKLDCEPIGRDDSWSYFEPFEITTGPRSSSKQLAGFGFARFAVAELKGFGWTVPCVALLTLWVVPVVPWSWHRWRTRDRRTRGKCRGCGYDLRASPGRCPECGHDAPPRAAAG